MPGDDGRKRVLNELKRNGIGESGPTSPPNLIQRTSLREVLSAAAVITEPPTVPGTEEQTLFLQPDQRIADDGAQPEQVGGATDSTAPRFVDRRDQAERRGSLDNALESVQAAIAEVMPGDVAAGKEQNITGDYANHPSPGYAGAAVGPETPVATKNDPAPTETPQGRQAEMNDPKTQMVRGPQRPTRTDFHQEPVVGWLVVIGGPGLGAFRPVFEGNNSIGRAQTQRVPIDFGDDTISSEEQAFVRYDASDREFLFVPNLAKTNVVSINEIKPTTAVKLQPMDVITMGQTQLVFVPFCGEDFDWSELADLEE